MNGTTCRENNPTLAPALSGGLHLGLLYLDVRGRRLYFLNDAARHLHADGLPIFGNEAAVVYLRSPTGEEVHAADLPLPTAVREGRLVEASYVLSRPGRPDYHLLWSVSPLRDPVGEITAILAAVCCTQPPPDWHALAGLAHDLRTPLQVVRLLSSTLAANPAGELPSGGLDRLQSAAERALQVGADLLEWCRTPVRGGRRVEPTWFALKPFLEGLVVEQQGTAERKGVILAGDLAGAQGLEVYTDRVRLGRVLVNLLSNAVRYTAAGGRVTLSAGWQGEAEERVLALAVADTGAGISPEEQESIFQPFERGRAGREGDSSGSGLGLAVVDRLVAELGLRREFASEHGRGSDFRILLPMRLLRAIAATK
jgi:hypothetical protein